MTNKQLVDVEGYAHRGLHNAAAGVIENSPSAIAAAIEVGVGIEIDLQMSAGRQPMVFHDETLYRLTGEDGRVAFMKQAELEAISYKNSADKIISLASCLEMVAGRVPLLLEVKSHWHGAPQMEEQLARVLEGYKGAYGVMSFDPEVIRRLKPYNLPGGLGLVTERHPPKDWPGLDEAQRQAGRIQFETARALEVDFIAHHVSDLDNRLMRGLISDLDIPLFSWTVNGLETLSVARKAGAVPIFEVRAREAIKAPLPTDPLGDKR